jgi:hypothetical protein
MQYLGDYAEDYATLNFKFSTHKANGTPATLSGTPAISVYKANGTTQSTAGITLTADFDSVTGLNNVLIDLSADAFYAVANDYQVVITTGTVDSVSVVGTVLAHFSIENRFNEVDVTKIGGVAQSATDLKDFADSGYDPSTHKVQGVVLTDTLTTNSDKTGYSLSVTPPTAAAIADAVCDEALSGHQSPGTVGITLTDTLGYASATRTALTDNRAAALDRVVGTIAAGTHNPQTGDSYAIVNNGTYGNSAIETLVDDLETRLTATRAGYLDNLMTAPPSASDIATAVWAAGTRTLSSFGSLVADVATAVWGAVSRTITGGTITTNSDKTGYALTGTDIADIKSVTVKLDTAMELDGAVYRFTANALEEAPSSSGGDATAANQTIIINHLTDVKGATFSGATDSLEAIRNRGDVAWITGGTGGGSNAVTINVKASAANVVDCYVEVWDSAGTSFISRTTTNSSGNVSFDLDNGTYTIKMHKAGYYFANQTLTVDGAESVAYTGTILTPTAPTDPSLCKVYGYYFDPSGNTFPAIKSMVKMSVAYEAADNNYFVESINGTYNTTTGELSFNIVQGADAILDIPFLNIKKRFTVPAETLYKISDII